MKIAILATGTELTRGELVNSNAAWMSVEITALGGEVVEHVAVADDRAQIEAAIRRLAASVDVILCTGGLGPTTDDLTSEVVAKAAGVALYRDQESIDRMRARFERLGRVMSPSNEKQADMPVGSEVIANDVGTAPGYSIKIGQAVLFAFPGVPREMHAMFTSSVPVRLAFERKTAQVHLRTFGLPESTIGDRLKGVEEAHPGVLIGYRAHFPEVEVKVFAQGNDEAHARTLAEQAAAVVHERLADHVYGGKEDSLPMVVLAELQARGQTLAIAESCTGGMVGQLLTQIPGSSKTLIADIVAYANAAKVTFLGVPGALIEAHGAVSEEVARAMADGVRSKTGASIGLAITGVAGPDGGTEAKPVGTVFIAVTSATDSWVERHQFPWHRAFVQAIAAHAGLWKVRALAKRATSHSKA
jgi:nicotinamide-nucleotide amidase